jgi:hypothetical protein
MNPPVGLQFNLSPVRHEQNQSKTETTTTKTSWNQSRDNLFLLSILTFHSFCFLKMLELQHLFSLFYHWRLVICQSILITVSLQCRTALVADILGQFCVVGWSCHVCVTSWTVSVFTFACLHAIWADESAQCIVVVDTWQNTFSFHFTTT